MKIEILNERDNKLLSRKEIEFKVDHPGQGTPSRADIRAKIVAQFDADSSAVVIRSLGTSFGAGATKGLARIYSDAEQMKRVERDHIIKRHEAKKAEGE